MDGKEEKKWKKILVRQLFGRRKKAKRKKVRYEQVQHKQRHKCESRLVRDSTEKRWKILTKRLQRQTSYHHLCPILLISFLPL